MSELYEWHGHRINLDGTPSELQIAFRFVREMMRRDKRGYYLMPMAQGNWHTAIEPPAVFCMYYCLAPSGQVTSHIPDSFLWPGEVTRILRLHALGWPARCGSPTASVGLQTVSRRAISKLDSCFSMQWQHFKKAV